MRKIGALHGAGDEFSWKIGEFGERLLVLILKKNLTKFEKTSYHIKYKCLPTSNTSH